MGFIQSVEKLQEKTLCSPRRKKLCLQIALDLKSMTSVRSWQLAPSRQLSSLVQSFSVSEWQAGPEEEATCGQSLPLPTTPGLCLNYQSPAGQGLDWPCPGNSFHNFINSNQSTRMPPQRILASRWPRWWHWLSHSPCHLEQLIKQCSRHRELTGKSTSLMS
jgi:hypothetical protein